MKHSIAALLYWIAMVVLSLVASVCLSKHLYAVALQASIIAIACAMYGAAHIINERND